MLQAIISPAKQMEIDADVFAPEGIPPFPEETCRLYKELLRIERVEGAGGLKALWKVNDRLLAENINRLHLFMPVMDEQVLDDPAVASLVGPAVFSYVGIQYRSMAPDVLDLTGLDWLDRHLWILSGFYGCIRPRHAVQPYRLEMGARLALDNTKDLYAFWGNRIARAIDADAHGQANEPLAVVNLASVEYAKAVLPHLPADARTVTCLFGEELRSGKPVQRATASKIARGSMVRWMAERGIERTDNLRGFDVGYAFAPELSRITEDGSETLVFMKSGT